MASKPWCLAGLFLVILVLSMPFYSAQALAASIQITRNSGEDNLPGYLDAQGDAWTVEATITGSGLETINPQDVKIKIGSNEAPFSSCSPGTLGIVCRYISPLTDGIQEAEYAFQVVYRFLNNVGAAASVSNGEVIRADGSAPAVVIQDARQNADGEVELDFTVNDKVRQNAPSVGIKTIEIIDADNNGVLQTISLPDTGREQFNYRSDGESAGILPAPLAGEGFKRIKVRASDWLGHLSPAPVRSFRADFVAPIIKDNLNFTDLGRFVGDFVVATDITIDVEDSSVPAVTAASSLAGLQGQEAECGEDAEQIGKWHCRWSSVEVNPQQDSISVTITARDEFGNTAERTLTKTFTRDSSPPVVQFFGTERVLEGKSYVRTGRQRIILQATEVGAGISADDIRANLLALGRSSSEAPTECRDTDSGIECYWDTAASLDAGVIRIGLSKFEDAIGNQGSAPEAELVVDNAGPNVERLELFGGDKDYVQSNDQLKIKVKAVESSGLVILVNVNGLVMDAGTKYPEGPYTRTLVPAAGWQTFTEEQCERTEGGAWECAVFTDPVHSGPERNQEIEVRVQDTAGNDAAAWPESARNAEMRAQRNGAATLQFDLLGLSLEENPDYWEVAQVVPLGGLSAFIDLEVTPLTFTRLPFEVRLRSTNTQVKMVSIDLQGCTVPGEGATAPAAALGRELATEEEQADSTASIPAVSRSLLYSGVSAEGENSPRPKIVLEFEPFDGKEMFNLPETGGEHFQARNVAYLCRFRIFSAVDNNALANAELQEVTVAVPFGYSVLGAQDARLEEIIESERKWAAEGFFGVIGTLQKILKWLDYLVQAYHLIMGARRLYLAASTKFDALEAAPGGGTVANVAFCFGVNTFEREADFAVTKVLDIPLQIFSCREKVGGMDWYNNWVRGVLSVYNIELLKGVGSRFTSTQDFRPARDPKDNLALSLATLCLPGIVKNLDRLRQVTCRKIYCLEKEVPANIATVSSCEELESLLQCKYVLGEIWYLIPFSQLYDAAITALQKALRDPIAAVHTLSIAACGTWCLASQNKLHVSCAYIYYFWEVAGWVEDLAGFFITVKEDISSGGLTYCDSVL